MQILYCVDPYLASRVGGAKILKPLLTGFRLRCGDYRVFFDLTVEPRGGSNKPTGKPLLYASLRKMSL